MCDYSALYGGIICAQYGSIMHGYLVWVCGIMYAQYGDIM